MPRTKLFNEEEILDKAMELFWRKGYSATSVQDLVQHLGINRASLYDTFGDKRALFQKAFKKYREVNKDRINDFLAQQSSVKTGFKTLFLQSIKQSQQTTTTRGCFVVNSTIEFVPDDPEMHKVLAANKAEFEGIFQAFLQSGKDSGELSPSLDPQAVAAYLFIYYSGINVIAKINPHEDQLSASVEQALAILDH